MQTERREGPAVAVSPAVGGGRRARRFGFVAAAVLAAAGLASYLKVDAVPGLSEGEHAVPTPEAVTGTTTAMVAVPVTFVTGLESLPPSLRDIEVDGSLDVDANGQLIINYNIRRLFEFFFNGVGEESVETAEARIRAYILAHLPESAQAEAFRVFGEYLALRRGMDAHEQANGELQGSMDMDSGELRRIKDEVKTLRQGFLSADVDQAFYGREDVFDDYTIAKLEIIENAALTAVERSARVAALEQQLPADLQTSIEAVNRHLTLSRLVDDWQAEGGDAAGVRQIRENVVGAEAADRLEQLDADRTAWNGRVDAWLQTRAGLLANPSLSEDDRATQLEDLRSQQFSDGELLRIQSLERLHDQGVTAP